MPQLSKVMKMTKDFAPKVSGAAKNYASKAADTTKSVASKASDYGNQAANKVKETLPKKSSNEAKPPAVSKSKKASDMSGISLTKAVLMIAASTAAALLFAPKSGKETRSDMKDHANKMKDKGMDEAKGMMNDAKETYTEVRNKRKQESTSSSSSENERTEVKSPIYTDNPDGIPVSSDDKTQAPGEADNLVTDEYVSDSAYDSAERLSVPVDEELGASSLPSNNE